MELNAIFGKIKLRAHKIDPSLGPSTDAVKARLKKAVNNLEKKLLKAEKRNHEDALIQIERVKDKLFPNGGLQEPLGHTKRAPAAAPFKRLQTEHHLQNRAQAIAQADQQDGAVGFHLRSGTCP